LDPKTFPRNLKFSNFVTFGTKKSHRDWVEKYPGQSWEGPLFTAGQKNDQVRPSQGPSLAHALDTEAQTKLLQDFANGKIF